MKQKRIRKRRQRLLAADGVATLSVEVADEADAAEEQAQAMLDWGEPFANSGDTIDGRYRVTEMVAQVGAGEVWACQWGKEQQGYAVLVHAGGMGGDAAVRTSRQRELLLRAGKLGAIDRAPWLEDERLLGYAVFDDYDEDTVMQLTGEVSMRGDSTAGQAAGMFRHGVTEFFVFMVRDPKLVGLCILGAVIDVVWAQLLRMPAGEHLSWEAGMKWGLLLIAQWLGGIAIFVGLVLRYYVRNHVTAKPSHDWGRNAGLLAVGGLVAGGLGLMV